MAGMTFSTIYITNTEFQIALCQTKRLGGQRGNAYAAKSPFKLNNIFNHLRLPVMNMSNKQPVN